MNILNDIINFVNQNKFLVFMIVAICLFMYYSKTSNIEGFTDFVLEDDETKDLMHILRFELVDRESIEKNDERKGTHKFITYVSDYCKPIKAKHLNSSLTGEAGESEILKIKDDLIIKPSTIYVDENTKNTEFYFNDRVVRAKDLSPAFVNAHPELITNNNFVDKTLMSVVSSRRISAKPFEGDLILNCDTLQLPSATNFKIKKIMDDSVDNMPLVALECSQLKEDDVGQYFLRFNEKMVAECCSSETCSKYLKCEDNNVGIEFKRLCVVSKDDIVKPAIFKLHTLLNVQLPEMGSDNFPVYDFVDKRVYHCSKLFIDHKLSNNNIKKIHSALNKDIVSNKSIKCTYDEISKTFIICGSENHLDAVKLLELDGYTVVLNNEHCVVISPVVKETITLPSNEPVNGGVSNATNNEAPSGDAVTSSDAVEAFASVRWNKYSSYGFL
jgi:hypothetical protein